MQIADMAVDLFAERGYDNTTVEDICVATGISRTSFFRYFGSKEDVLLREFNGLGHLLLDALVTIPETETPWTALRKAIGPLAAAYAADDVRNRRLITLVIQTPSLRKLHQDKLEGWVALLRPEVARRLGGSADKATDPVPAALIASILACLDAALAAWVASEQGNDLGKLFLRAANAIG
jgi:AcrR family transcriptional regulator